MGLNKLLFEKLVILLLFPEFVEKQWSSFFFHRDVMLNFPLPFLLHFSATNLDTAGQEPESSSFSLQKKQRIRKSLAHEIFEFFSWSTRVCELKKVIGLFAERPLSDFDTN